ncbi:DUF2332 domain-containing protein [Cytobacillus depressus]|uniref:DUF2332 domain-containing protein n=1 Tax=Cytobacillus depressus TaxID=1602942 RepID=A0A6L3V511_9BACI|nr:DUF2332 domain-containing protein [Cytobacillus depressus]KAB2334459.1 DUF2332 domain-containing protein [Cytobacillus depressus]
MLSKERLSRSFIRFATHECKDSSKLYEYLSLEIAKNDEILELCTNASEGQPVPNLLFGAVHYLLLKGKEHKLKEYYPSVVSNPKHVEGAFNSFKDFCFQYQNEIISILQSKLVQTNEVRRCAYLYPVFSLIYEKTKKPLALIEIGTSAGLQLLWDKYSYSYGTDEIFGNKSSALNITSEIIGENMPFLASTPPPVSKRMGLDLNTIDLNDEEETLWMKSLIWPEHKERLQMFEQAASYIKKIPVQLVEGDGIGLLRDCVNMMPSDSTVCIFHTHVANQMPLEAKKILLNMIQSIGKERDVFHIYNNIHDRYLHLDYYVDGVESKETIAETDGHGRWFRWLIKGSDFK